MLPCLILINVSSFELMSITMTADCLHTFQYKESFVPVYGQFLYELAY